MTDDDYPWEPPTAGPETEQVLGALDRQRTTFRWKADGLDTEGLQTRIGASALTIGGLLKHLALTEDFYFTVKLSGEPLGEPWQSLGGEEGGDWEFVTAADDTPDQLYAVWDEAVERSRQRLRAFVDGSGLDQPVHAADDTGQHASLRRLLLDLVEEYGRHTGHTDLLREAVDGLTGEDPPAGWRVTNGTYRVGDLPGGPAAD